MENTEPTAQSAGRTRRRSRSSAPVIAPGIIATVDDINDFVEAALDIWPERYRRLGTSYVAATSQNDVETCPTQTEAKSIYESWPIYQAAEHRRRLHSSAVLQDSLYSLTGGHLIAPYTTTNHEQLLKNISLRAYWLSEQRKMMQQFPDPAEVGCDIHRRRIEHHHARIPEEVKTYLASFERISEVLKTVVEECKGEIEFENKYGKVQGNRISKRSSPQRAHNRGLRAQESLRKARALVLVAQDINRILES